MPQHEDKTPFDRFVSLTKRLLEVPKSEAEEKDAEPRQRDETDSPEDPPPPSGPGG